MHFLKRNSHEFNLLKDLNALKIPGKITPKFAFLFANISINLYPKLVQYCNSFRHT